jgi:hypothetical protein
VPVKSNSDFIQDVHYYLEEGRVIFTPLYHINRGTCCGNSCRHCPYEPKHIKGNKNHEKIQNKKDRNS